MRLHPITQLLLLAAMLVFGADAAGLIAFGKAVADARESLAMMPATDVVALFMPLAAPPLQALAYGLGIVVFAVWTEVLARILATLQRLNAQSVES